MSQTSPQDKNAVQETSAAPNLPDSQKKTFMSETMFGTILCIFSDTIFCISYLFVQFVNKCDTAVEFLGKVPVIGPYVQMPILPEGYSLAISPFWTTCFKELITTVLALPIFLIIWKRGKSSFPPLKIFLLILVAAFFCETVGVNLHIFSFAAIGLALALPFIRTFTIFGTSLIGAVALKEKLSLLKIVTIIVLITAAFLLVFSTSKRPAVSKKDPVTVQASAQTANSDSAAANENKINAVKTDVSKVDKANVKVAETSADVQITDAVKSAGVKTADTAKTEVKVPGSVSSEKAKSIYFWGFLAAFVTGLGYAIYTVILRAVLRKASSDAKGNSVKIDPFFIVSVVCGFGAISAALIMLFTQGTSAFYTTNLKASVAGAAPVAISIPTICWIFIATAGILNVICFYLKNLSLRYATASKVATFSVLQILLQTIFGIFIFHEITNTIFFAGLGFAILGIVLASRTK